MPNSRLLVVQTARAGDAVLTIPLLAELRRCRPEARITLLTTAAGGGLLSGQGHVDECWILDKDWTVRGLASWSGNVARLLRMPFDEAVAVQRSRRSGQALLASRAPVRIGFEDAPGRRAYTVRVTPPAGAAWRRLFELSRPLGGRPERARPPSLTVDRGAARAAIARLDAVGVTDRSALVALSPGSARASKRWPDERFAEVARSVASAGLQPVLVGAEDERGLCERIARLAGGRPAVLAGRLSLLEWVAVLAEANVVVANDSAAGHVAAAVRTPVVSVFGPTAPVSGFAPAGERVRVVEHTGLACRPCSPRGPRRCPEGHWRCMRELGAEAVVEAVFDLALRPPQPLCRTAPG